jgi:hypothetical protein
LLQQADLSAVVLAEVDAAKQPKAILRRFFILIRDCSKRMKWREWLPGHGQPKIMNPDGSPKNEEDITETDLMMVDIGPFYCELVRNAASEDKEGITLAVSFVMARMGDNMAESWC